MRSAKEAVAYLKTLHSLVRYLGISDGNMQEGSFRCDANVSVRRKGDPKLGTRTEVKNVNSFRFVERAINYEIQRQIALLEAGGVVKQQTVLYDADKNETRPMRSKEEANDYRYFPDPDLLPLHVEPAFIESLRKSLPELPLQKRERFMSQYNLTAYDANILASERDLADYFESAVKLAPANTAKLVANWVIGDLLGALNKANLEITASPVSAQQLATIVQRISDNTISGKIAKSIFEAVWQGEGEVDAIIEQKGLKQITDNSAIEAAIDEIIAANPQQVEQYRGGKETLFGFFVGQVMKKTQGKANPQLVNEYLRKKLS
jgi:aspartyl-tRNA(Asn)/glutamyl-tRNA(Gln) amidotransferase subunit B